METALLLYIGCVCCQVNAIGMLSEFVFGWVTAPIQAQQQASGVHGSLSTLVLQTKSGCPG